MMLLLSSSTVGLAADKPVKHQLTFYGTQITVRVSEDVRQAADTLTQETLETRVGAIQAESAATIDDLRKIKIKYRLCDWAYLKLVEQLSQEWCGKTHEASLFMYTLLCMSGYDCRLATTATEGNTTPTDSLRILAAIDAIIYNRIYYKDKSNNRMYYPLYANNTERLFTYKSPLTGTKAISLVLKDLPLFDVSPSEKLTITAKTYPDMTATYTVNRNLVNFFDDYPSSQPNDEFGSRWVLLANTPLSEDLKKKLYPQLQRGLKKCKTDVEKVARILNMLQPYNMKDSTLMAADYSIYGLPYEYDDSVWNGDRAFFAEETLFYRTCDSEDRAILFTRLVRDLVGLPCALIYYPGHLAAAVQFKETIEGKTYVAPDGSTYTVCDPTYANATIGMEMPFESIEDFDVKLIPLK